MNLGKGNDGSGRLRTGQFCWAKPGGAARQAETLRQDLSGEKSGASGKRPRLEACLEYIREGDTLVVTRLDRLARSTLHLCQIAADPERKQINLQVLDQNINTTNATARLLFNRLGAIAQFETEIRAERQMDGIQKAKERGVHFGRKKRLTVQQVAELRDRRDQGALIKNLSLNLHQSRIIKADIEV
jgi:DNA invertase Pin-like site-specific DNA recombinase